jgi:hypothetical protein
MGLYVPQLRATIYIRQCACQLGEEAQTQSPRVAVAAEGRIEGISITYEESMPECHRPARNGNSSVWKRSCGLALFGRAGAVALQSEGVSEANMHKLLKGCGGGGPPGGPLPVLAHGRRDCELHRCCSRIVGRSFGLEYESIHLSLLVCFWHSSRGQDIGDSPDKATARLCEGCVETASGIPPNHVWGILTSLLWSFERSNLIINKHHFQTTAARPAGPVIWRQVRRKAIHLRRIRA